MLLARKKTKTKTKTITKQTNIFNEIPTIHAFFPDFAGYAAYEGAQGVCVQEGILIP